MSPALRLAARRALRGRRVFAALLRHLPRLSAALCLLVNPLLRGSKAALPAAAVSFFLVCLLMPALNAARCRWLCGRLTGCPLRLRRRQKRCVFATAVCLFWLRALTLAVAALPPAVLFLALRLRLRHGGAGLLSLWIDGCGLAAMTAAGLAFYLLETQRTAAALPLALLRPGLTPLQAVALSRRRTEQDGAALLRTRMRLHLRGGAAQAQFLLLLLTDYAGD